MGVDNVVWQIDRVGVRGIVWLWHIDEILHTHQRKACYLYVQECEDSAYMGIVKRSGHT